MLETVSSRRLYGALVLTVLPSELPCIPATFHADSRTVSFGIGFYLKDRQTPSSSSPVALEVDGKKDTIKVEERVKQLKRKEAELGREMRDVEEKLRRVRDR